MLERMSILSRNGFSHFVPKCISLFESLLRGKSILSLKQNKSGELKNAGYYGNKRFQTSLRPLKIALQIGWAQRAERSYVVLKNMFITLMYE